MDRKLYFAILLLLIVCGKLLAQAPDTMWVSTFNGPANGFDGSNACVVDNQGNLYVVGSSEGITENNVFDFIIFKYNTVSGDTIWTRLYNGPADAGDEALDCVLDNSGNLFVVGYSSNGSNDDFLIIKYNTTSGDTLWTRRFNGITNGKDRATDCSLDDSGNLYVTGISGNGINLDFLTIKYNTANGDTVWTRIYNGAANGNDHASGCSLDGSGNLFISGYSYNGFNYNLLTIKYNGNGDTLWTRKSKDTLDFWRFPKTDCVSDNSGNVYVIGMCGLNENFQNRYSLITKYNSFGDSIWVKRYDGLTSYDQPLGCTLDGSGNLYVTGTSYDGNKDDCFTIKYNSVSGNILWTKRYIGPSNSSYGISCVVDDSGYLYITGQAETNSSGFDNFTIKYESTVTSVQESSNNESISFALKQNYPNPFNPKTTINYQLETKSKVQLNIYDISGRKIKTLVNSHRKA